MGCEGFSGAVFLHVGSFHSGVIVIRWEKKYGAISNICDEMGVEMFIPFLSSKGMCKSGQRPGFIGSGIPSTTGGASPGIYLLEVRFQVNKDGGRSWCSIAFLVAYLCSGLRVSNNVVA